MSDLQIFKNDELNLQIRTIEEEGKILFCGSDVARALGYARPNDAISAHCRATVKRSTPISGKTQDINFITEGDVYRLVAHSKLPNAEKFESWIFDEVLPQIRKTGGYIPIGDEETDNEFLAKAFIIAAQTLQKKDKIIAEKNKQLEEQEPLVYFASKVSASSNLIDMGKMAKLLKDEKINIGRNRLFQWLRKKEILMKNNIPYQKYIEGGYFQVKESAYETPYGTKTNVITLVTGKGQIYITEKLRKEYLINKEA